MLRFKRFSEAWVERYHRTSSLRLVLISLLCGAAMAAAFVLIVMAVDPADVFTYVAGIVALEVVAIIYICGPRYADHLFSKEGQAIDATPPEPAVTAAAPEGDKSGA